MLSWNVNVGTLFPDLFPGPLGVSCSLKAIKRGICTMTIDDLRIFGVSSNQTVDDTPFGGGPGMIIRADVVDKWLTSVSRNHTKVVYMSPRGVIFNQKIAHELIENDLCILCGRYEGVDARVLEYWNIQEISIGNFITFGGELPAMILLETCIRLLPGSISKDSVDSDTFQNGLLEYNQYTRPSKWKPISSEVTCDVPKILLSGDHAKIKKWRDENSKQITYLNRPDLLGKNIS